MPVAFVLEALVRGLKVMMGLRSFLLFHSTLDHGDPIVRSLLWDRAKRRSFISKVVLLNNYWVIWCAHRTLFVDCMIVLHS